MNWTVIGQDIISNAVSGLLVAGICGVGAWLVYITGIKGKEKSQIASERKNTIFIPLKYEMKQITELSDDIWQNPISKTASNIVDKEDEFVVDDDLYHQCGHLIELMRAYRAINPYRVATNILHKRFDEKYAELYGSITHHTAQFDFAVQQEIEFEDVRPELRMFYEVARSRLNIDNIFQRRDEEEAYQSAGFIGPAEEYMAEMFSYPLPKKDKYAGIIFDNIKDQALVDREISPAQYMAKNFDFFNIFDESPEIREKSFLLSQIRQVAFEIYELSIVKIRNIGNKYEKE